MQPWTTRNRICSWFNRDSKLVRAYDHGIVTVNQERSMLLPWKSTILWRILPVSIAFTGSFLKFDQCYSLAKWSRASLLVLVLVNIRMMSDRMIKVESLTVKDINGKVYWKLLYFSELFLYCATLLFLGYHKGTPDGRFTFERYNCGFLLASIWMPILSMDSVESLPVVRSIEDEGDQYDRHWPGIARNERIHWREILAGR